MNTHTNRIVLYYKFQRIDNPEQFSSEHKMFCEKHQLVGRILIGKEGINGTCAGTPKDVEAYKAYVHSLPGFKDLWFKEHDIDRLPLQKMSIKCLSEIVVLKAGDVNMSLTAPTITPKQFNEWHDKSKSDNSIVFLDIRNKIESDIGKFEDAIPAETQFFREFGRDIEKFSELKDKTIITYCTGGIRCEKATAFMKQKGFKNLYQLEGGIYNYCAQYPKGLFKGSCFVFDDRMQIAFMDEHKATSDIPWDQIISHCEHCEKKSNRVVNDERKDHRHLIICCEACDQKHDISRVRYGEEKREMISHPTY